MAAEDHLSSSQFYDAPNGTRYHLSHEGWNSVMAHKVKKDIAPSDPELVRREHISVKPVGGLNYFSPSPESKHSISGGDPNYPEVFKAVVNKPHQRRGLASAMFDFADQHAQAKYGKPLQHSSALSEEGKSFAEGHERKRAGG